MIIDKNKDIFHAFLVKNAKYDGELEIPIIERTNFIPKKLIPFSVAYTSRHLDNIDYNSTIVFYEDDYKFERIWNKPDIYLSFLKKFNGVISPDFSLYRNMPLIMQGWNTFRGKALGHYFQENGINVIPNVRFSDERSFKFCFNGIPQHGIISIGTHGCIKTKEDKKYFKIGLSAMIEKLKPHTIIVYGSTPDDLFSTLKEKGICILQYNSATYNYHKTTKVVI